LIIFVEILIMELQELSFRAEQADFFPHSRSESRLRSRGISLQFLDPPERIPDSGQQIGMGEEE